MKVVNVTKINELPQRSGLRLDKTLILDGISFIARFYMAYIWLKAGFSKLGERLANQQSVEGYDIFSEKWAGYIAELIAPLEIAGGILLLVGIFLRFSGILSTIVLALFIVGITQAWARGLNIDCGCFGVENIDQAEVGMNYAKTIARDVLYIFLSMWTAYRPFKKWAIHA
ncbi:DoxX family protein [Corynebacterium kutscheri]|uniref:DoxX family protein n=1 Tax=Corynebacterium kutscheri TaxID=35755 RepID=UPI000F83EEC4